MKSPLNLFFKMGEKATGGDPDKQQDFIYYMLWILFLAFVWLFAINAYKLFFLGDLDAVTWTLVGFAISSIQYFSLKGMYDAKQMRKKIKVTKEEVNIGTVEDMMKGFDNEKVTLSRKNSKKKSK